MAVLATKETFKELLPRKPYYCDEMGWTRIAGCNIAIYAAHIQFNGPTHKQWLVFDIDRHDAYDLLQDPHVPPPNIICINPVNNHAHLYYLLETPVRTAPDGSAHALRYCAAVEQALRTRLGGDVGYARLLAKNPLHPYWHTMFWRKEPYSLGELADWFTKEELNAPVKAREIDGLKRNVTTFEILRHWAYSAIKQLDPCDGYDRWHLAVYERCAAIQHGFINPLSASEVRAIAKSVARWTYQRLRGIFKSHTPAFIQTQRERGKKGGQCKGMAYEPKRAEALTMRRSGMTIKAIAEQLEVSEKSINRWTQSERGQ